MLFRWISNNEYRLYGILFTLLLFILIIEYLLIFIKNNYQQLNNNNNNIIYIKFIKIYKYIFDKIILYRKNHLNLVSYFFYLIIIFLFL